jgi:hypothetical protein
MLPMAQDLLSDPASQAFVERLFSLCGLLTVGRRNSMDKITSNAGFSEPEHSRGQHYN